MKNNVLITGFDRFGVHASNPSEELVNELRHVRPDFEYLVMPTDYGRATKVLEDRISDVEPRVVVMLGYSTRTTDLRVDLSATNRSSAHLRDNSGALGPTPIVKNAPDGYRTQTLVDEVVNKLRAEGYPFRLSPSAGTFVCNYVYFWALHDSAVRHDGRIYCFIHMPDLSEQLPKHVAAKAVVALSDELLVQVRNTAQSGS